MAKVFDGFGKIFHSIFNREIKISEDSLEEIINKALANEREKITITKDDMDLFGWVTKDNNPIHKLDEEAKKKGFERTPVMGAHLAAYGEEFIYEVNEKIKQACGLDDIHLIKQTTKLIKPVYPDQKILWQLSKIKINKDENLRFLLSVEGCVKKDDRYETAVAIEAELDDCNERNDNEKIELPDYYDSIITGRYLIEPAHIEQFCKSIKRDRQENKIPLSMVAAYVPATLLTLLEQKANTMEGKNFKMCFQKLNDAFPRNIEVDIFKRKEPFQKGGNYIYKFESVCTQKSNEKRVSVVYGEIMCATEHLIKDLFPYRIRPQE